MPYEVFWLYEGEAHHKPFTDLELIEALTFANDLRRVADIRHVTVSPESPNSVGKLGVTSVEDGKTPDGHDYTWRKRR